MKFHSSRGGTERSKTDGVVAHLVGFVTSYYGPRMCVHDSAHVKLFFVDMVNDKLFSKFLWYRFVIEWTHNVDLVILHKAALALVHIYDVIGIVYSEDGITSIPVNKMALSYPMYNMYLLKHDTEQ